MTERETLCDHVPSASGAGLCDTDQEQEVWTVARELCGAMERAGERLAKAGLTADEMGELLNECIVMADWPEHFDDD